MMNMIGKIGKMTVIKLQSERELTDAIREMDALLVRNDTLSSKEKASLERLTRQIREYEDRKIPMPRIAQAEALKYLLDSGQISAKKLALETGVRHSIILDFLKGQCVLDPNDGAKIARRFKLRADFFESSKPVSAIGK
jgi:antitoxin component HigA of HigAB toxin-antitoxin module